MPETTSAIILMYHSISEGSGPNFLSPALFSTQMQWLKRNAHVVPLESLVESLNCHNPLPPTTVALTFDDGFADFYSAAAPVLKQLELPSIVFFPPSLCGKKVPWIAEAKSLKLMSWHQVRDLAKQGVSFGSHSMSHNDLTGSTESELHYETCESKRMIETETGQEVRFFCYPYGRNSIRTRRAVSDCYSGGACSTDLHVVDSAADRFALPRIDVHYLRSPALFQSMFTNRFLLYINARRILRNLRSRNRPLQA